jgi:two-component system response regulator ArlR
MSFEEKNILIVDDDYAILRGFKAILEKEGYFVETADCGESALERLQTKRFNLVLLDVKLPDINGIEVLQKIGKDSDTIKIMITGFSTEEVGKKAAEYGADDYLVKPVTAEELLEAVRESLLTKKFDSLNG